MKTCIVTGAASGIGLATTRVLLDQGWRVVALDRDDAAMRRAAAEVGQRPVSWHAIDITDEAAIDALVDAQARGGDGVAALVNNAAIGIARRFVDTTPDDLRRLHEVNVVGSFIVARAVVRALHAAGRPGAIVQLVSTAGQRGHLERTAYGATKAALILMTRVMASELADSGIRVNAVSPGAVATPLVDAMHTPEMRARWTALTPQRRYGEPREIAEAIAFLLDDAKAGFITGHVLDVDGGLMAAGLMAAGSTTEDSTIVGSTAAPTALTPTTAAPTARPPA